MVHVGLGKKAWCSQHASHKWGKNGKNISRTWQILRTAGEGSIGALQNDAGMAGCKVGLEATFLSGSNVAGAKVESWE